MTITYCNNLDELLLKIIPLRKEDVDFFYMSIGSKLNETVVHFKNENKTSNASYQMIPQYLRNPHTEKIKIVIIFDVFSNKGSMKLNKTLLLENETSLTKIFMINYNINSENIRLFGLFISSCIELYSFLNEKTFMICNFIKFMNIPNQLEKESEKLVEEKIIQILNKTKFENSYYVWFGYNRKLYNFIFNKNNFSNIIDHYTNIKKLESYMQKKNFDDEKDLQIIKHVYDLTEFDNACELGAPSLYDTMCLYRA